MLIPFGVVVFGVIEASRFIDYQNQDQSLRIEPTAREVRPTTGRFSLSGTKWKTEKQIALCS
jgi:hypothetical protein